MNKDARTAYLSGMAYLSGSNVERDYTRAAEAFRRGAELGSAEAELALGYLYERGFGVPATTGVR